MRKVIVTGASSGMGAATASKYLLQGHKVVLVSRKKSALQQVVNDLKHDNAETLKEIQKNAFYVEADVGKSDDCKRIIEESVKHLDGEIDVLINNAGVSSKVGSTCANVAETEWDEIMNVNLKSMFLITKYAIPYLEKSKRHPAVVNVSSIGAYRAFAGLLPYCVSKAGVDHFTRCVAFELAGKGIRVNSINPGAVETNFSARTGAPESMKEAHYSMARKNHPMGRIADVSEVANIIYFLASNDASFVNGQCITVDGGKASIEGSAANVAPTTTATTKQ